MRCYKFYPNSKYLLVDIADDMLKVAKQRFQGIENIAYQVLDYKNGLPDNFFDTVISALSIHHLENDEKMKLFERICQTLPDHGIFVNYDQFCAGNGILNTMNSALYIVYLRAANQEVDVSRKFKLCA